MAAVADPKIVEQKCTRFHDTYIQFITRLSDAYPNSDAVKSALLRAVNLETSPDFVVRTIQLCQRWMFMVNENRTAFADHECSYLLVASTSVFADMELPTLIAEKETWSLFREAFWTFVDRLTKTAEVVVRISPSIAADAKQLEQDAKIIETIESVGIKAMVDANGRFGVDMSAMLNMKDSEQTVRTLKEILQKSGVDISAQLPAAMKSMGF